MKLLYIDFSIKFRALFFCLIILSTVKTKAQWSVVGNYPGKVGVFNANINCITKDKSGNLYAGGFFTNDSGKFYVAKWNGGVWSELGGMNTSKFTSEIKSITTDASGNLYVAGATQNVWGGTMLGSYRNGIAALGQK